MTEYIVNVPDNEAEYFIEQFGFENVKLMGYNLTDEIVRCKDCAWCTNNPLYGTYCTHFGSPLYDYSNGYCAWADKKWKEGSDD